MHQLLKLQIILALAALGFVRAMAAESTNAGNSSGVLTSLRQLRVSLGQERRRVCSFELRAVVRAANPAEGSLFLQDDTEASMIQLDWGGGTLSPGQQILLKGKNCAVGWTDLGLNMRGLPVVDVDGSHPPTQGAATAWLHAGRNPLRLVWFNDVLGARLDVDYSGPGLRRRKIPDSALFRGSSEAEGASNQVHGLDYRCFEGVWDHLPDFAQLTPVKIGVVNSFDIRVRTRDEHVGLEFTGDIEVASEGRYRFYLNSDDGARLFISQPMPTLTVAGLASLPPPRQVAIGDPVSNEDDFQWVEVEGEVSFFGNRGRITQLELGTGEKRLQVNVIAAGTNAPGQLVRRRLRATGVCQGTHSMVGGIVASRLVTPGWEAIQILDASQREAELASVTNVLTTAAQVQRLSREEAQQGYPVKLKGVITYVMPNFAALVLQDSTRAIFVTHYSGGWDQGAPSVGECWEIQGISNPADFSPVVQLQKGTRVGPGQLPEPVHPTWDQLINGSLDSQYVELEGIVTGVHSNTVSLLTRMGSVEASLLSFPQNDLLSLDHALVRIRGCLFAEWDRETHRVKLNHGIVIGNPIVSVEEPAPAQPFDATKKTAAELLYFDPQASAFQRVRVSGQVLQQRESTYFMCDGTNGVRFTLRDKGVLQPGDMVEVAGFQELGGPSPVLREALARKTGVAALPSPRTLLSDNLIHDDCDSTMVRVAGVLVNARESASEETLEVQSGLRTFIARAPRPPAGVRALEIGSRLELTGVYVALGGSRADGRHVGAFELLLNNPADIQVVARPSWWTLKRLGVVVAVLVGGLALAIVWINLLRRQVEKRTRQLEREIQQREQAERRHAIEKERTRIARDIHDELGCSLAQIRLLSEMTLSSGHEAGDAHANAGKISGKALEAARVMDEIVWAVDPQHDTLESFSDYLFSFGSDYLALAGIRFRIDAPMQTSRHPMPTQSRHQLFMAVKEALNNIVKHSGATEVWIRLRVENGAVTLLVEDNGRGIAAEPRPIGRDASGLANMRKRLEEIGGRFAIEALNGHGTRVRFELPLTQPIPA